MIIEINNLTEAQISKKFIRSILNKAIRVLKTKITSLSIALVDAKTIKALNKKYRRVNKVTDVLAFNDPAEIIISWPRLIKQATQFRHSRKKELVILLIHGLLHILGYDHRTKKEELFMERKANEIIKTIF